MNNKKGVNKNKCDQIDSAPEYEGLLYGIEYMNLGGSKNDSYSYFKLKATHCVWIPMDKKIGSYLNIIIECNIILYIIKPTNIAKPKIVILANTTDLYERSQRRKYRLTFSSIIGYK